MIISHLILKINRTLKLSNHRENELEHNYKHNKSEVFSFRKFFQYFKNKEEEINQEKVDNLSVSNRVIRSL